jgi:glycosyltransferase involved in cell wall biosynthesis
MKVALVHDHLAQDGGAEKVLRALADLYPDAPIYTLLYDRKNVDKYFRGRQIETSIIQKLPGGVKHYQWYMPFMPMAVEFFDLRSYDLVISDASAFAKGVITSPDTLHICYCHTPTRYVWDYTHQYINELDYNKYLKKVISLVLNYIRLWDKAAADRVDIFIANSSTVKRRIAKYYKRSADVIYPPVETGHFRPADKTGDYYLIGGRLAPYKRVDIAIEACKLLGARLKIFGDGVDLKRLRQIAGGSPLIEFLGRVDDAAKAEHYQHCRAFINPQEEDFGITVVEAMAAGRPVIAYARGGAVETVRAGVTGIFFEEQSAAAIKRAIEEAEHIRFDPAIIRAQAEKFSTARFKTEIKNYIEEAYRKFKQGAL